MKFIDFAKLFVTSGKGGAGCVSMRREKYVEFGGPNGGDGGKGGDVYIVGDERLSTLYDLRLHPHQKAGNGMPGLGNQKTGRQGGDKHMHVPLGTIVFNDETQEIYTEVLEPRSYLLLKGGLGGAGNMRFKTATNRAPRYAQPGLPGEECTIRLELKLMADVGLVGFPNAGKSTFISAISNANPKIADYPFTTMVPNLGVVQMQDFRSFVVADIPGILEGAHQGVGLGDTFLKHIQRSAILAFLIDASSLLETPPKETFEILLNELKQYAPELLDKKRIVLLSKIDALHEEVNIEEVKQQFKEMGEHLYPLSSVSGKGVNLITNKLADIVQADREQARLLKEKAISK